MSVSAEAWAGARQRPWPYSTESKWAPPKTAILGDMTSMRSRCLLVLVALGGMPAEARRYHPPRVVVERADGSEVRGRVVAATSEVLSVDTALKAEPPSVVELPCPDLKAVVEARWPGPAWTSLLVLGGVGVAASIAAFSECEGLGCLGPSYGLMLGSSVGVIGGAGMLVSATPRHYRIDGEQERCQKAAARLAP